MSWVATSRCCLVTSLTSSALDPANELKGFTLFLYDTVHRLHLVNKLAVFHQVSVRGKPCVLFDLVNQRVLGLWLAASRQVLFSETVYLVANVSHGPYFPFLSD